MKTYVITLSKRFPAGHNRAGDLTFFHEALLNALHNAESTLTVDDADDTSINIYDRKIHTIRGNYPLWEKRIGEVERGEACLSIREWIGKPYHSKQVEIVKLTKENGVGIQKAYFLHPYDCGSIYVSQKSNKALVATNDGLSLADWMSWFSSQRKPLEPMAVIHFTKFRY